MKSVKRKEKILNLFRKIGFIYTASNSLYDVVFKNTEEFLLRYIDWMFAHTYQKKIKT